jgi:tetratricopeptide (TPR) repeat protein
MTGAKCLSVASALAAWIFVTAATPYNEAASLYENGRYREAVSLAAKINTASSLALAARASLAYAIYMADPTQRSIDVENGAAFASKALDLDPDHVEAHLQLVIALHQQARASTAIGAFFLGYADEARFHLDTALKLDPLNPWVHSLIGGWHFEVVRRAGSLLAQDLYGASLKAGRRAFFKAFSLKSRSIVMQYNFARALLLTDPDTNPEEAVRALEAALAATPTDHLDKIIAGRARAALDAVKSGSSEDLLQALGPGGL